MENVPSSSSRAWSVDPTSLKVAAFDSVAISLYLPGSTQDSIATVHQYGDETGYAAANAGQVESVGLAGAETFQARFLLCGLDVEAGADIGSIVCIGDSITDGAGTPIDSLNRWPDRLAHKLVAAGATMSVVNLGISGNRLLRRWNGPSLLARLDRDVLSIPAIRWLVFLIGINDLGAPGYLLRPDEMPDVDQLSWGMQQIATRVRDHGIRVMAGTLTPSDGFGLGYSGPGIEEKRPALNEWIRTTTAFDAIVDFDAVLRDPAWPLRMRADFDSGDHLHPNPAGFEAMASAVMARLPSDRTAASRRARASAELSVSSTPPRSFAVR